MTTKTIKRDTAGNVVSGTSYMYRSERAAARAAVSVRSFETVEGTSLWLGVSDSGRWIGRGGELVTVETVEVSA